MFDGFKLNCTGTDFRAWEDHPDLEFKGVTNLRTGELLPEARRAEYNGLLFKIAPSTIEPGQFRCYLQGSLHRFANDGGPNDGAFSFDQVRATIRELETRFGIDPNRARLENLEIGINIPLPFPVRKFMPTLICHYWQNYRQFSDLDAKDPYLGKAAHRQQYSVKLYDKGKQAGTGAPNVLRLEIHISKMLFLEPYKVATLADLTDPAKVAGLAMLLQKVFAGVMLYDGSAAENTLSEKERANLNNWKNPLYWLNLDKDARYNNRQRFAAFIEKHRANSAFLSVVKMVPTLWENLQYDAQKNSDELTDFRQARRNENCDELTVKIKGQNVVFNNNSICDIFLPETPKETTPPSSPNTPTHKRKNFQNFCACCGRDISGQRRGSRYCSETRFGAGARRCRDTAHHNRQKEARRIEAESLHTILPDLLTLIASVAVFAMDTDRRGLCLIATAVPAQVAGTRFVPIRSAVRVELSMSNGPGIAYTKSRAKKLLSYLANLPAQGYPSPPNPHLKAESTT
ncbi:MAG: hypothetical protein WCR52_12820 [Bacteroidota bacterium]